MQTHLRLRSIDIGRGLPKICVPLVAPSLDALADLVARLNPADFDLVELRLDLLAGSAESPDLVREAVAVVRRALPDGVPILATYRTPREGGTQAITAEQYFRLNAAAIATGLVDAVDVELMTEQDTRTAILAEAQAVGVATVVSNHDFDATPDRAEIVARLRDAQDAGASVAKIAVMPHNPRDVVTLLDATEEFVTLHATVPAITMAMGPLGVISRVSGEAFGSAMTFGAVGATSAPGQIEAGALRQVLAALHTD